MEDKEIKKLIEGALFISGRNLSVEELARICEFGNLGKIKNIVESLKEGYESRDCAIKIFVSGSAYLMDIDENLKDKISNVSIYSEMTKGMLKTLGFIAYHQPIKQVDVFKNLGYVYGHVKKLEELKFIDSYREKNFKTLKTTKKFDDYFSIRASELKSNLKKNEGSLFDYK